MQYTVKKLAKISGVSVRALHWWDKVGLLKPTFYGENGYRYYSEKELLTLQQILFFKELDFSLSDIQKILGGQEFDKLSALQIHRKILEENIERKQELIATIDRTIEHLRGEKMTTDQELYYGFDSQKQKEYERYLENKLGEEEYSLKAEECRKNTKGWTENDMKNAMVEFGCMCKDLAVLMSKAFTVDSKEVQKIIANHYIWIQQFWKPNRESYIGLGTTYTGFEWKKAFEAHDPDHPMLAGFLAEGMRFYAEENL